MSILAQACGVVTALSDFQVKAMEAINARFFALRRLAELLEQAGDVSGFLPNLQALIPLSAIDLSLYLSMQANCPFLNLPSVGSVADPVGALRRELDTAYAALLTRLKLHPHFKLTRLQQRLDEFQSQINFGALQGANFLMCLQSACQAGAAVEGAISSVTNSSTSSIIKTSTDYLNNIVNGGGNVLSTTAQRKADDVMAVVSGVNALRDTSDLPALQTSAQAIWKLP